MKKLIVPLLLCFATIGVASAEWRQVGEADGTTVYVDTATIRKVGEYRDVWVLYDYKKQQKLDKDKYLSGKYKDRYDCTQERLHGLSMILYSGGMGTGSVVFTTAIDSVKWSYVAPETLGAAVLKVVCR